MPRVLLMLLACSCAVPAGERIPAFPGAEGAGAYASGGRGGEVYRVTNLNAGGPGSLADAVSRPNRTVVFTVSGVIDLGTSKPGKGLSIPVAQPNITIAGQTAPGEGICFKNGSLNISASNVIVRYLRSRRGQVHKGDMGDALTAKSHEQQDVMIDHVSASWATDENLTLTNGRNVTAQWSINSEALDYFNPNQTPPRHAFGSLFGSQWPDGAMTIHHTIYAHNRLRSARTTGGEEGLPLLDFRNNIIYDSKELTSHTGSQPIRANWVGNYVKDGPSTGIEGHDVKGVLFTFMSGGPQRLFADGNYIEGHPDRTADNWRAIRYRLSSKEKLTEAEARADRAFETPFVTTDSALDAREEVLADAGCTLPGRDVVDLRIIRDIRNGTGAVVNFETDLEERARWPVYHSLEAPQDTDEDGIPDYWEEQFGFDPYDKSDAAMDPDRDGYTNIEEYLNNTDLRGGQAPVVFVSASVSRAYRGDGYTGEFRVSRSAAADAPLTLRYALAGNAAPGEDYERIGGELTIPAGSLSASIPVVPVRAGAARGSRMLVLRPAPGSTYKIGLPSAALVMIEDGAFPSSANVADLDPGGGGAAADREASREVIKRHVVQKAEKIRKRK